MNKNTIKSSGVVKAKSRKNRKSTKESSTKKEESIGASRKKRASSTKPKLAKVGKKKILTQSLKSLPVSGLSETGSTISARSIESDLKISNSDKVIQKK